MTLEEMQKKLQETLPKGRFQHSVNVMHEAVKLAEIYGEDKNKAAIAGLLHDCAKGIKGEEALEICKKHNIIIDEVMQLQTGLLHGPIGSHIADCEYGVKDPYILNAIYYHTTGCENMDRLTKIIYIADYIEPNRSFYGVEKIRRKVISDLDEAIIIALNTTIKHVITKGHLLHINTINARNYLIKERGHISVTKNIRHNEG